MNNIAAVRVVYCVAELLHNGQSLHRRKFSTHALHQVIKCASPHKRRHRVKQVFTLTKFEEWQNIWMVKLANFFGFGHKVITEGPTLSIAWAENLHRYLKVPFSSSLASAIHVRHSPLTDRS